MTTRVGDDSEMLEGFVVLEGQPPQEFDPKTDIDITGLDPAEVLLALHQNTQALGMGRYRDKDMTKQEAINLIQDVRKKGSHFDYVFGRPIKISLIELTDGSRSWIHRADLYDRNSKKPAKNVVAELRAKKS